jgi:hypothetical protein
VREYVRLLVIFILLILHLLNLLSCTPRVFQGAAADPSPLASMRLAAGGSLAGGRQTARGNAPKHCRRRRSVYVIIVETTAHMDIYFWRLVYDQPQRHCFD